MSEQPGVLRWFGAFGLSVTLITGAYVLLISITASPSIYLSSQYVEGAQPFIWVSIIALSIFAGSSLINHNEEIAEEIFELSPEERIQYVGILILIMIAITSTIVGVSGILGYFIATSYSGVGGVVLAFLYPSADSYISSLTGYSVGVLAAHLVLHLIKIGVVLAGLSSTATEMAEADARRITSGNRRGGRIHT